MARAQRKETRQETKPQPKRRCADCARVRPITDRFTRVADGAPLLGDCLHRGVAVLLSGCECEAFEAKTDRQI